jgi:hypothetical protein
MRSRPRLLDQPNTAGEIVDFTALSKKMCAAFLAQQQGISNLPQGTYSDVLLLVPSGLRGRVALLHRKPRAIAPIAGALALVWRIAGSIYPVLRGLVSTSGEGGTGPTVDAECCSFQKSPLVGTHEHFVRAASDNPIALIWSARAAGCGGEDERREPEHFR